MSLYMTAAAVACSGAFGLIAGIAMMIVSMCDAAETQKKQREEIDILQDRLASSRDEAAYWRYECDVVLEELDDSKGAREC